MERTSQRNSLDVEGGKEELSTRSWTHTFMWINDFVPICVSGSDLSNKEYCGNVRMYLEPCLKCGSVLGPLLEYIGNVVISEVVLECVN